MGMKKQIIVIHGLGRSAFAMASLAKSLRRQGYDVTNVNYPSRTLPIADLVNEHIAPIFNAYRHVSRIDVVTHSLGGVLFRYFWAFHCDAELKAKIQRVVMLAPPNHGSEVAERIKGWPVVRWIMGPAVAEIGVGEGSLPIGLLEYEQQGFACDIGVIAGTRSYEPWLSRWISDVNDGKVSVSSTRLPGMKDFTQINVGHTFIMDDKAVRRQIFNFLEHGVFTHSINAESKHGN